jgi:tRNA threonylcarbamoyladenosine biosynthesis protein TsaB
MLTHSQRLLPMLDQALALAARSIRDVQRLVVSGGPGSFTGLRIGLATAKGLAHAGDIPVVLVSTLEGLAFMQPWPGLIVSLLDARKQQVYAAIYRKENGKLIAVLPPAVMALNDLLQQLSDEPALFVGEGAFIYRGQILAGAPQATFAEALQNWPRASSLALLAESEQRPPTPIESLHPDYLRASSAEQKASQ